MHLAQKARNKMVIMTILTKSAKKFSKIQKSNIQTMSKKQRNPLTFFAPTNNTLKNQIYK